MAGLGLDEVELNQVGGATASGFRCGREAEKED